MENFNLFVGRVINTFGGDYFHMIHVRVTIINGKFPLRASDPEVSVTDGVQRISCFMARISGNQKEINASFMTDGFTVFSGNVEIEFGYADEIMGVFENFDIQNGITPLDPLLSGIIVPNADNAWLEQQINP